MAETATLDKRESTVTRAERTRDGRAYLPNCDIIEKSDELLLVADVPGARPQSIDVNYERGLLTLQARIDPDPEYDRHNYLLREYGVGDFYRTFQIGEGIDASRIEAEIKDGVLTLHLPKAESAKPKRIVVKGR